MESLKAAGSVLFWIVILAAPAILFYIGLKWRGRRQNTTTAARASGGPQVASFRPQLAAAAPPSPFGAAPPSPFGVGSGLPLDVEAAASPETPRERTLRAVRRLMSRPVPSIPTPDVNALPILWDGERWHVFNLAAAQFWGFFGTKQYGKSWSLKILALLALLLGPKKVQVWAIDPKGGADFKFLKLFAHARVYGDIPNLDGTIDDGYDAAVEQMLDRYAAFDGAGLLVANIRDYHAHGHEMPYVLLLCDEVGDLTSGQREKLDRLARQCGAAGMTLVVSTQYPERDKLSGQVQENLDHRLSLKLATSVGTRVALAIGPGDSAQHDPSVIEEKGVAIYRYSGREVVGRVPYLEPQEFQSVVTRLVQRWPRTDPVPAPRRKQSLADRQPAQNEGPTRRVSSIMGLLDDLDDLDPITNAGGAGQTASVSEPLSDARNRPQAFQGSKEPFSGVPTARERAEQEFREFDFGPTARLILASPGERVKIIENTFGVKAGSSARYQVVVTGIDAALAQIRQAEQNSLQPQPEEVV